MPVKSSKRYATPNAGHKVVSRRRFSAGDDSRRCLQTMRSGCLLPSVMKTPSAPTRCFSGRISRRCRFSTAQARSLDGRISLLSGKKGSRRGRFGSTHSGRNRFPGSGPFESKSRRSCRSGTSAVRTGTECPVAPDSATADRRSGTCGSSKLSSAPGRRSSSRLRHRRLGTRTAIPR